MPQIASMALSLAFSWRSTGAAYCWGDGWFGRLGYGDTDDSLVPTPVAGGLTFTAITAGNAHTCGLTTDGAAYCWGNGWDGQLGDGSNIDISLVPTPVAGGLTFTAIAAGPDHTCGLSPAGAAYCWGHGGHGRLGTGDTAYHLVPEPVAGGFTFTDITAEADHTCGLTPA